MSRYDICIVGAGEAGVAAAATFRQEGFTGRIALLCDEYRFPYERPPLSKEVLLGVEADARLIRPESWYAEMHIDLHLGARVVDIAAADCQLTTNRGGDIAKLSYGKLLLATGARVRELAGCTSVRYLRTFEEGEALRLALGSAKSIVVIGGGVIGLEVASSATALGLSVTVVDLAPRLMARALAPDVAHWLEALHKDAGVSVLTDVGSVEVEARDGGQTVVLGDGKRLPADLVIAGIGVVPNDGLAQLAGCRLDNGIVVDGSGRTTVENIFAAGDVAAFHHPTFGRQMRVEAWQHAGRHGSHVARAMLGVVDDYCEVPWFWTDQHGTNLQVTGIAAGSELTVWRGETASRTGFHFISDRLVGATTINNGRDMRPAAKLIAAGWRGDPELLVDTNTPLGKLATQLLSEQAI